MTDENKTVLTKEDIINACEIILQDDEEYINSFLIEKSESNKN